jgi:hypothetical protein
MDLFSVYEIKQSISVIMDGKRITRISNLNRRFKEKYVVFRGCIMGTIIFKFGPVKFGVKSKNRKFYSGLCGEIWRGGYIRGFL